VKSHHIPHTEADASICKLIIYNSTTVINCHVGVISTSALDLLMHENHPNI